MFSEWMNYNEWPAFSFALMLLWSSFSCYWTFDHFSKNLNEEEKNDILVIQLLNFVFCVHAMIIMIALISTVVILRFFVCLFVVIVVLFGFISKEF